MGNGPILILSGTNRPSANAMKVAKVIQGHYRAAGVETDFYSLAEMPRELFDPASYAVKPQGWELVQRRVVESRGLHVVSPEYNGSFPGVLKYFIDMLKFPESFERKPVAFVGEAAGVWGAIRPVEQLQLIFGYRNAHVYPERVFIPGVGSKFDAQGSLIDPAIDARLKAQAEGFAQFVQRFL